MFNKFNEKYNSIVSEAKGKKVIIILLKEEKGQKDKYLNFDISTFKTLEDLRNDVKTYFPDEDIDKIEIFNLEGFPSYIDHIKDVNEKVFSNIKEYLKDANITEKQMNSFAKALYRKN